VVAAFACSGCNTGTGGAAWAYVAVTAGMLGLALGAFAVLAVWLARQP
jgi:hypothetical protein